MRLEFQVNQFFDLHVYVTAESKLDGSTLKLVKDRYVSNRVVPSFPKSQRTSFHLFSFRTRYDSGDDSGLLSYFFPSPKIIESILVSNYSSQGISTILYEFVDELKFVLPPSLRY